jgi:hypothetical protein
LHGIRFDNCDICDVSDDVAQDAYQTAVDFNGGDRCPRVSEGQRERAQARADFDNVVARANTGKVGDAADRVWVRDEVLPQIAPRG